MPRVGGKRGRQCGIRVDDVLAVLTASKVGLMIMSKDFKDGLRGLTDSSKLAPHATRVNIIEERVNKADADR